MSNSALRKARDLSPDVRGALEALLGRPLREEETISIQAYATHEAPTGSAREEAWERLMERIDKTAARVTGQEVQEASILTVFLNLRCNRASGVRILDTSASQVREATYFD